MPLERVHLELLGETLYDRAFQLTSERAEDMSEPLGQIGERLLAAIERQFETEGRTGLGHKWAPLDDDYRAWKEAHYPGQPILQLTGAMKAAMTSRRALTVTPRKLSYDPPPPEDRKARWHHEGAGGLPARPIVVLNKGERRQIDRIFAAWLREITRPLRR